MVDATHKRFEASDRSYYSLLKKEIHALAEGAGFVKRLGDLDLIVSEMTSNLYKYAKGGQVLFGICGDGIKKYLEVICIDNGPGMSDAGKMLTDGVSSTQTMGMGLGSIRRLSDTFDLYSVKGWGTIVLSQIYLHPQPASTKKRERFSVSPLIVCMPGQIVSGDGMYLIHSDEQIRLLMADGLGHGRQANEAINAAVEAFKICPYQSPSEILRFLHDNVRKTRGLVAAVLTCDLKSKSWKVAGVGNIAIRFSNFMEIKNQMSYNGIVGHNIPNTINDQEIPWSLYNQVTLCSDGIRSRWDLSKFPGIMRHDLAIQAAAIFKENGRMSDDMSVVTMKII